MTGVQTCALPIYRWDSRSKSWMDNPDADVVRYLTQGEGEFQEVTEEVARKIFPQAF